MSDCRDKFLFWYQEGSLQSSRLHQVETIQL